MSTAWIKCSEELGRTETVDTGKMLKETRWQAKYIAEFFHFNAGLADKVEAINTAGVGISKEAAGDNAKVFASIGPSGKMLVTGEVTEEELREAFSEQADAQARAGADALVDYFRTLLAERRRHPGDDLMSLLLRAEHEGDRLSPEEVVSNCVLLLFAGHETTTNLLGNGLFHLLRNSECERALRAQPALVERAVEEFLRIEGPVTATIKVATEDLDWRGARIRCGERVIPFMASANRDPRQFDRPDALDIERRPNRHLAFGYGIHFCLGAPLARLEAQLAFSTLLRRFPRLELLDPEPRWKPQIFMRGLETLPLRWAG